MTDLVLGEDHDLLVSNGQLVLISTQEELTRQRLLIHLNTFTKTWFENQNFGINQELIFAKNTKELLDRDIKTIITETVGVTRIREFFSSVGVERIYRASFIYETESGEIVSIKNLSFGPKGLLTTVGLFEDGIWNYYGVWEDDMIWPE